MVWTMRKMCWPPEAWPCNERQPFRLWWVLPKAGFYLEQNAYIVFLYSSDNSNVYLFFISMCCRRRNSGVVGATAKKSLKMTSRRLPKRRLLPARKKRLLVKKRLPVKKNRNLIRILVEKEVLAGNDCFCCAVLLCSFSVPVEIVSVCLSPHQLGRCAK